MALLTGIAILLYEKVKTGVDAFNVPVYTEKAVKVEDILIAPVSTNDIEDDLQLYGKHAIYELHIPKTDSNNWENKVVEFYGQKWRTYGLPIEYMEHLTPGPWNRKVKVERYG